MAYDEKTRSFTEFVVVDKNNKVRYRLSDKKDEAAVVNENDKASDKNSYKGSTSKQDIAKYCQDCNSEIQQNVAIFSSKHFGKPLCYNCQQKHKAG